MGAPLNWRGKDLLYGRQETGFSVVPRRPMARDVAYPASGRLPNRYAQPEPGKGRGNPHRAGYPRLPQGYGGDAQCLSAGALNRGGVPYGEANAAVRATGRRF
jgi:hypothetical protein